MSIEDDETLQVYIDESLEHLADIENDFLAIEGAGADIDEDLVNKVYRAAHSIKGGAGFMGLTNIKDLTHEMENILGRIRSRQMVPNAEIINILLLASDAVRSLLNDVGASNEADISQQLEALRSITLDPALRQEEDADPVSEEEAPVSEKDAKEPDPGMIDISFPDKEWAFAVAEESITDLRAGGKYIYLVEIDLIEDVHNKDTMLPDFLDEMSQTGMILAGKIDVDAAGTLEENQGPERLPFAVLFATILKPDDIDALFQIDRDHIYEVKEDQSVKSLAEPPPSEPTLSKQELESGLTPASPPISDGLEGGGRKKAHDNVDVQAESPGQPAGREMDRPGGPKTTAADTSLRVHVSLLDSLMTLAGELVLSRNQLLQSISSNDHRTSEIAGQRIDLITSELQEAIMLTRMQPIGNVFGKFPRVVRDMAKDLGKEIELVIEGKDVELDKTIIEAISDPLTHLVRNSVDHGIETPDERSRSGKVPKGTVLLRAYHEAGQVNIEISDDGKGIDGNKLAATAADKGLITEDQAKVMSDKEKVNLIFLPGFSTAKKVTDVSGRGVGMDVVKTNLDKLGGVVDIDSEPRKGATIRIKLPLTLAIIPSQIISTGGERYAIPQVNMEELFRIPADQVKDRIERVGDADVVRLRGKLLPLIRLADVIGTERTYFDEKEEAETKDRRENIADRRSRKSPGITQGRQNGERPESEDATFRTQNAQFTPRNPEDRRYRAESAVNIVVVSTGALKYGLVVDQLHDSEEIVVKPLGRHLKHCKGYAGATIMGDGRVALILDVAGLSRMAELTSVEGTDRAAEVKGDIIKTKEDAQSLLIFRSAEEEQFSVPLGLVSRIEKTKRENLELVGGKKVMQYRGESLPLVAIDDVANVKPLRDTEDLLVIVFVIVGREVGLLATAPVDAAEVSVQFDETTLKQPGIMGSAIIDGYTTLMLDIFGLVETSNPDWFAEREATPASNEKTATILYAEDSKFFRTQVKGFIEEDGYNVLEAEDGLMAWDLLQEHAGEISLVVTDMEMPNLDGFGLAERIKGDDRFSHVPVIGLTTLAGDKDMAQGKEVGIDDYQIKLDREKLLESIHYYLEGM
ncbi:MAG: chemotaxis protein CheW [Thermodesulfobacteriota bacterium]|nr:chemotaxis protein CheW [Thermodesulfobacteriota bacterium]